MKTGMVLTLTFLILTAIYYLESNAEANSSDPKSWVDNIGGYRVICMNGVYYYRLPKLAPAYRQDGTLYLCEVKK